MIFKNWVLQNFPFLEDDFDALTDYELFCKMVEYMKKSLEKIKDYQNELDLFSARLDEFQHYFDNLDVQEEINNKLDEMAESGELTDIIAQYLQLAGVLAYNTVADMVDAENLVNGSICRTLGYDSYNDGKGYYYKIRTITNEDVIDNINIIALDVSNTLVAERIFNILIDKSNPIYYGADPTGTIDSSTAIQKCLDANINKEITFTCGTYLIENPIEISYENQYGGINFNNSKIIDETDNDYSIGVGTKNHELDHSNNNDKTNRFYNITNLKMETSSTYAILIDRWFMNVRIDNVDIITSKNGIQIGKLYDTYENTPSDTQISNFIITNTDMTGNYEAITVIGTDNKFVDGRIYGFKTGINANENLLQLDDMHFLACNFDNANLNNDYACIKNATIVLCNMCYCDSYPCFIQSANNLVSLMITNLYIFSWHTNFTESAIIDLSKVTNDYVIEVNYKNVSFSKSNYPTTTQFIKKASNNFANTCLLNGFNSYGNIRILGVTQLTNIFKDLSMSKKGLFSNEYFETWRTGWIPLGYLNIINDGIVYINIYDDNVGIVTFKVNISSNTVTATRLSQTVNGYDPTLGFKLIEAGVYKVCFTIDKDNVATYVTNVQDAIEMNINPNAFITPITLDLSNEYADPLNSVDITSTTV